jgi:transcription antitermination factor NusA-like protein
MKEKLFMNKERLNIKEKRPFKELEDLLYDWDENNEISLSVFINRLEKIFNDNVEYLTVEETASGLIIYKTTYRDETDQEYGKRVAKETAEYNKYLKLKEKFEGINNVS